MIAKFQITLEASTEKGIIAYHDTIPAENLVELFSKLLLSQALMMAKLKELEPHRFINDDDIPF